MPSDRDPGTSAAAAWPLIAIMICGCVVCSHGLGFTVSWRLAVLPCAGLAVLAGALSLGRARRQPRLIAGATAFLQMTLFTIVGVVLSYILAARAGPLWDARLAAADARLGFDWPAIIRAAAAAPWLLRLGAVAYYSLVAQMIVCIVVLSGTRRFDALRTAVAAAILGGAVTIAISGLMPAMGNVFDPAAYAGLWPSVAWEERHLIAGLRDGSGRVLDLSHLAGIVSFPSYHATLPLILAWAQRDIRVLRVATWIWAALTIAATPLFGGHYGVDVLAGIGLAVAAIAIAPHLVTRRGSAPGLPGRRRDPRPIAGRSVLRTGAARRTSSLRRSVDEGHW